MPRSWPEFEASVKVGSTRHEIRVRSSSGQSSAASEAILDELNIDCVNGSVRVPLDGGTHRVVLDLSQVSRDTAST
jgi:cyclic beta-1,2-glucan synthetase